MVFKFFAFEIEEKFFDSKQILEQWTRWKFECLLSLIFKFGLNKH